MITLSMQNTIHEISNQVDIENDPRWISEGDIQYLILMLDITHGGWVTLVKAKAGAKRPMTM